MNIEKRVLTQKLQHAEGEKAKLAEQLQRSAEEIARLQAALQQHGTAAAEKMRGEKAEKDQSAQEPLQVRQLEEEVARLSAQLAEKDSLLLQTDEAVKKYAEELSAYYAPILEERDSCPPRRPPA